MNRHTVRLAVLTALGLPAASIAGIPDGPIPELENEDKPAQTEEAPPKTEATPELVAARWKHVGAAMLADPKAYADTIAHVEGRLSEVPGLVGRPLDAKLHWGAEVSDLNTLEGRIDTVLLCISSHRQDCDVGTMMSRDAVLAKTGATPSGNPGFVDLHWRWHHIANTCPNPIDLGGCSGRLLIDARAGTCGQESRCRRGRPFLEGRHARLDGETRTAAGEAWAAVALEEHASVASFALHVLELMAVGAPPELLAEATQAQLDEVRHAELALELARDLGAEVAIGPLDTTVSPRTTLVEVLRSVAEHGCVGETLSAVECAIALEQTEDPRIREVLDALVADEARHAALAWKTLAWGLPLLEPAERASVLAVFGEVVVHDAPESPAGIGVLGGQAALGARTWALESVVGPALAALRAG